MTLTGFPDDSAVCAAFLSGNLLQNEKNKHLLYTEQHNIIKEQYFVLSPCGSKVVRFLIHKDCLTSVPYEFHPPIFCPYSKP
jgi:hypothetical protein